MTDPNVYVHKLLCPITGPNDCILLHVQVPRVRPIQCDITLHASCRGKIYKAELRHSKRATYKHDDFDGDGDALAALLIRALLPSESTNNDKANEKITMSAMSFPSRVEITFKAGGPKLFTPFAVLRLYPTEQVVETAEMEKWALQACHERDRMCEELGTVARELEQTQDHVIQAQNETVETQKNVVEAQTAVMELQETVADLCSSLTEQTKTSEQFRARLQNILQLQEEKARFAALEVALSASKHKIRELTDVFEQYGSGQDLLNVESGSETLLIEHSGQTPSQTESNTPEQQPCKKRKMNYLQDE